MKAIVIAVLAALALSGCKDSATDIGTLLVDPSSYDGKTVTVAGKVGKSIGALGYGAYEVVDDTGRITVVSKTGGAPREGSSIVLRGEFRSGFTLGTTTTAVVIESERSVKP